MGPSSASLRTMPIDEAPAYFIVACMGHSGSTWLSEMLGRHPDIVCSHAYEPPPFSIPGDAAAGAVNAGATPEEIQRRLNEARYRIRTLPLDELFQELFRYAEARAYGNIHMYNVRSLRASAQRFPPSTSIKVANLIRHPVAWVDSRTGNFIGQMNRSASAVQEFHDSYASCQEDLEPLVAEYGLDLTEREVLAFLAAVTHLGGLIGDVLAWPDIWFVKMEDLTCDRESFAHFVREITAGKITADAQYLDSVFAESKRNTHSKNSGLEAEERYTAWSEWQRRAYGMMSRRFRVPEVYGKLGYDLSFIE